MERYSDFAEEKQALEGDKINIEGILNKEIVINGYRLNKSKYDQGSGKCLTIQIEVNGETKVVFTGSTVLINQIERYKDKIPFIATIKNVNKYYTLA